MDSWQERLFESHANLTHFNSETFAGNSLTLNGRRSNGVCAHTKTGHKHNFLPHHVCPGAASWRRNSRRIVSAAASAKDTFANRLLTKAVCIQLPEMTDATLNGELFVHSRSIRLDSFMKSKQPKMVQKHLFSSWTQYSFQMYAGQSTQGKSQQEGFWSSLGYSLKVFVSAGLLLSTVISLLFLF